MSTDKKKSARKFDGFDSFEVALAIITGVLLIFTYIFAIVLVDGPSMLPTLHDKERLVMEKQYNNPKDYDIVIVDCHNGHFLDENGRVYETSGDLNENIVKRVIATEGQTVNIDFDKGIVYVDGKETDSSFCNSPTNLDEGGFEYPITIPKGYVFVMGDNRNKSMDSRSSGVGLIDKNDILGKVVYRISPLKKIGKIN